MPGASSANSRLASPSGTMVLIGTKPRSPSMGRMGAVDARLRGDPQARLPGTAEDRLALQFSEGEIVGYLTEHLGQGRIEGAADRSEQLG